MPPKASGKKRPRSATSNELQEAKRQATTTGAPGPNFDVDAALAALPDQVLRDIVRTQLHVGSRSPLGEVVNAQYKAALAARSNEVIDFDHHSKSVWRELNATHSRKSSRWQFEASGDAEIEVSDSIRTILEQATEAGASKGTKRNALVTLRKIGKTICLTDGQMGHEIRNGYCSTELCEAMKKIVKSMSMTERVEAFEANHYELIDKVTELHDFGAEYCIMDGLEEILALAGYEMSSDEED